MQNSHADVHVFVVATSLGRSPWFGVSEGLQILPQSTASMVTPHLPPEAPLAQGRAETPIAFIQAIAAAYAQRGMRIDGALKAAQIEPKLLKKNNARITALQMEVISGLAMQELDDEGLGWFSRRLPWGSYGMLVRASLTSPTLGVALARWCRHHGLLTDDIALQLTTHQGWPTCNWTGPKTLATFVSFVWCRCCAMPWA
jgi:hypothetical protein